MKKYEEGDCTICENFFRTLHWHHTVPQALGGKDSLQIPLCGSCHTILHAQSEAIVAYKRGGKKPKLFWANTKQEQNAAPYLEILVTTIIKAEDEGHVLEDKEYIVPVPLRINVMAALRKFKTDEGHRSLPIAILFCIKHTLMNKGYLSNGDHFHSKQNCSDRPERTRRDLW